MIVNLEILVQLIVVVGFISGGFKYIVISPLQRVIEALGKGVECLNRNIERLQDQQHGLDKRLGIVEEQIKVINHRIGDVEEVVHK